MQECIPAYLHETARTVEARADDSSPLVGAARLAGTHVAQSAAEAIGLMYEAGGGTSIYNSTSLDRCFRDVNTLTHQFLIASPTFAIIGQKLLGSPKYALALGTLIGAPLANIWGSHLDESSGCAG